MTIVILNLDSRKIGRLVIMMDRIFELEHFVCS